METYAFKEVVSQSSETTSPSLDPFNGDDRVGGSTPRTRSSIKDLNHSFANPVGLVDLALVSKHHRDSSISVLGFVDIIDFYSRRADCINLLSLSIRSSKSIGGFVSDNLVDRIRRILNGSDSYLGIRAGGTFDGVDYPVSSFIDSANAANFNPNSNSIVFCMFNSMSNAYQL